MTPDTPDVPMQAGPIPGPEELAEGRPRVVVSPPAAPPPPPAPPPVPLFARVAEEIAKNDPAVEAALADILTKKDVETKAQCLAQAYELLRKLGKEQSRLKPDQTQYNEDGTVASASWSKAQLETRNKLQKRIKKLQDAVNKKDYNEINNLIKSGGEDKGNPKKGEDDAD